MTLRDHPSNPRRLRILARRLARLRENGNWFRQPFWMRSALLRKIRRLASPKAAGIRLAIAGVAALGLAACPKPDAPIPGFAAAVKNPFSLAAVAAPAAPAFADIDGDGDFDLFAGGGGEDSGEILWFENTGTNRAPAFAVAVAYPGLPAVSEATDINYGPVPVFGPLFGAGQHDLLVGHSAGGTTWWEAYEDDGSTFTEVNPVPDDLIWTWGDYARSAAVVDIDNDGLVDAFVSSTEMPVIDVYVNTISFYKNTGTTTAPVFTDQAKNFGLEIPSGSFAYPTFVDIDADGDFDAFVGDEYGDIWFFANTGTSTAPEFAPAFSLPFGLEAVPRGTAVPTFVDIDGDGDSDLFVGDVNGDFWYFANTMY